MKPYICPVCEGRCTMPPGFFSRDEKSTEPEPCRVCNGRGVLRDEAPVPYPAPYPVPYPYQPAWPDTRPWWRGPVWVTPPDLTAPNTITISEGEISSSGNATNIPGQFAFTAVAR